ncbi:MAG: DoxX family protein [Chthoniobacterales bacterium]
MTHEQRPDWGESMLSTPATRYLLRLFAFLRIYLGVILLVTVLGKLTRDAPFATEMLGFLGGVGRRGGFAWYIAFIQQIVVPHPALFSYLVMTGELAAAVSLLTGTLTRAGALIAMLLFLNYMLAKARMFWSPDSEDAAVFFIAMTVFLSRAGRVWGVDSLLSKRWPRFWLW